ncbi:MAG: segregation/condensation protein A, partial [Candidatus Diapherotrites archaeon]|nr:segregation/condensation protein A [Candidatus Diapherotrites archaeon]
MHKKKIGIKDENSEEPNPQNVDLVDLIEKPAWKTILIDLVKSEKMDPWNIDIAILAEKYLEKIHSLKGHDLRIPANAILATAILLKFKSRVLKFSPLEEEEESRETRELTEEEKAEIERMLPELSGTRKEREGKISLDDLVHSIETMLEKSKQRVDKRFLSDREKPEFRIPLTDTNIEELVEKVFEQ